MTAGLMNLKLPETVGRDLPDNIRDLQMMITNRSPSQKKSQKQKNIELESSGLLSDVDD